MLIKSTPDNVRGTSPLNGRLGWLLFVVLAAFTVLVGRLWQLQVMRGEDYFEETRENVVSRRLIPAVRGKILDAKGHPLADNRPAFNLYVTPSDFSDKDLVGLAALLGLDEEETAKATERLQAARKRSKTSAALLLEDQGRERAGLIRQEQLRFPGVEVRDEPYRHYPNGKLTAHLVGYMNQITADELLERSNEGYEASEKVGRYGLERAWEHYLRGKKGMERFVVNASGDRVEGEDADGLIDGPAFVAPRAGHDVYLTLDLELQRTTEKALLRHAAGAVAVVEVDSGRILALASTPAFDPNEMTGHLTREREAQLMSDPRKPFVDKSLQQHYPPGSIYKFVTAIATMEDSLVDEHELLSCPGYLHQGRRTFRCLSSHEKLDLRDAIKHSCNVYFWKLSERIGIDRMAEVARDFGFGAPTGLGLNGDVSGRVPTKAWYEERDRFKIGYTLNAATGQGDVEITVLQMAMAYAAIANGGTLFVPQVVERVETAEGNVALQFEPQARRRIAASAQTLKIVREGMYKVVNELGGTAYDHARSELVPFAGKTGTAQVRAVKRRKDQVEIAGWHPQRDHAWFAGFAPYDDPEIAVVVLIEHGGSGGKEAAPVAREIIEGYLADRITASLDPRRFR